MRRKATTVVASGAPRGVLWSRGTEGWRPDDRRVRDSGFFVCADQLDQLDQLDRSSAGGRRSSNEKSKPDSGSEIRMGSSLHKTHHDQCYKSNDCLLVGWKTSL